MRKMLSIAFALSLVVGSAREARADSTTLGVDFASTPTDFGASMWNLGFEFQANTDATVVARETSTCRPLAGCLTRRRSRGSLVV